MITIISTIVGFLASLMPAALKLVEKRQDHKHELELRELEVRAAAEGVALQTRLEQIKALIEQNRAIYSHDESIVGSQFINSLRASVRPVITYAFFILFCTIKLLVLMAALKAGMPADKLLLVVWDEYTASIFGAILSFWFGSRLWEKSQFLEYVTKPGSTISTK